jgi:hypothetical protein
VLKHPPYSHDLTPSDLFGPLKDTLRSSHFASDQEAKEAVHVTGHSANFFYSIQKPDGQSILKRKTGTIQKNGATVCTHCNPII